MTDSTHPEVSGLQKDPADKSTPRPWKVNNRRPASDVVEISDAETGLRLMAQTFGEHAGERAHLIVTAVNAYPALLKCREALEEMVKAVEADHIDSEQLPGEPEVGIMPYKWHEEWLFHAKEALALLSPSQDKPGNSDSTGVPPDNRPALPYRDGGE